ncbi:DNA adenine methylase [Spectribacter hydrogenooxidans]|uniref:site-specific DNA-methyltransferase (adenine-specific) n=1 Tax=Spectribacter hydrogenoxidans TaxID=3075608 RepID=A0ABU3BXZ9_9GAMM|nr:DNA adenine methylase [Salinisphaera sp. W335]MDT0634115.1 DNA adenine methylase [Salinisphaera sp. W335]
MNNHEFIARRKINTPPLISPLRYPGGKRRFARSIADILNAHLTRPLSLFIEPFAGSAAVAIALLEAGYTERIALCDTDPLIGNFWRVVFGGDREFSELCEWIERAPITLDQFHEVRGLTPRTSVEAAFKCLFLNRTSFSGVLHRWAGPIGGSRQASPYTIDCRFPREAILHRLDDLHRMKRRVLYAGTRSYNRIASSAPVGRLVAAQPQRVLWYLDPPFFCKAEKLYNHVFGPSDHRRFREFVDRKLSGHWIVSYDDVPQARSLWSDCESLTEASLTYSASAASRKGVERSKRGRARELILSSFFGASPGQVISLHGPHRKRGPAAPAADWQAAKA